MKTLYLDCGMGAAGDMLGAALLALIDDAGERDALLDTLNAALDGKAAVRVEERESRGVHGLHLVVDINGEEEGEAPDRGHGYNGNHGHDHDHDHHNEDDHNHEDDYDHSHSHEHGHDHDHDHDHGHTSITELRSFLSALLLPERVRANAIAVFDSLAEAESEVHGCEMENVHFHEVGSLDAVADVLCTCLLMEHLAPECVLASPINAGGGTVSCAHGILPVPAPATERLLRGLPWYEGEVKSELCTPTGAALLRHFVNGFGPMPTMQVERCGYGLGKKEFEQLNALRAFWGEADCGPGCCDYMDAAEVAGKAAADGAAEGADDTTIDTLEDNANWENLVKLSCNLDDMTGEELGFALEELMSAGALDAWTTPIGMKKGRPGVLLSCLGREEDRDTLLRCFFRHTTTLGVRVRSCDRVSLSRESRTIESPLGTARIKRSEGCGITREKVEYEDLAAIARENGLSLREARELMNL